MTLSKIKAFREIGKPFLRALKMENKECGSILVLIIKIVYAKEAIEIFR